MAVSFFAGGPSLCFGVSPVATLESAQHTTVGTQEIVDLAHLRVCQRPEAAGTRGFIDGGSISSKSGADFDQKHVAMVLFG